MERSGQNHPMMKALQSLLDGLCVDLGFCLSPDDQRRIVSVEHYDAHQFTREVFWAEGMNPDEHLALRRQVRRRFTDRFGASVDREDFMRSQE